MATCKCGFDMDNEHYCEHQHGLERTSSCSPDGYVSIETLDARTAEWSLLVQEKEDEIERLQLELENSKLFAGWGECSVSTRSKKPIVLVIHGDGNKEFCRVDYTTCEISGSIGFTAISGDINKARKRLYT